MVSATSIVDRKGPKAAYAQIDGIARDAANELSLLEISAVGERHPLVRLLRKAVPSGQGIASIRFEGQTIDGQSIDDLFINRVE